MPVRSCATVRTHGLQQHDGGGRDQFRQHACSIVVSHDSKKIATPDFIEEHACDLGLLYKCVLVSDGAVTATEAEHVKRRHRKCRNLSTTGAKS